MKYSYTARGFRFATFKDRYGEECSIQESSSVTPSIWLGVDNNRMHLSRKMVNDLIPLLIHFADHGVLPEWRKPKLVSAKKEEK